MIPEKLVLMANQIAANSRYLPTDQAAEMVAAHLRTFWSPVMRDELETVAAETEDDAGLTDDPLVPVVRQALDLLRVTS